MEEDKTPPDDSADYYGRGGIGYITNVIKICGNVRMGHDRYT